MTGSPIIQDEKLVGAATHVLVTAPTGGYGTFIENILDIAEKLYNRGNFPCNFLILYDILCLIQSVGMENI